MQLWAITDSKIKWLAHSRFIKNPHAKNESIIQWLEQFGLSVSDVLEGWFTTPTNFSVWPNIGGWYKDYTSWRSFQASFKEEDGSTTTLVNKWNDVFEWDTYRRYHKEDGTYVWQELVWFLLREYSTSTQIQEQALKQLGRPTYTTIPLSVSKIQKTLSEKGKIIDYNDYLRRVLEDFPEYKEWLVRMLGWMWLLAGEKFFEILNLNANQKWGKINIDALIQFMEQYEMWTYMYLIKGMNTRLVEHKRIGKGKLEFVLREEYPDCISENGELDKRKVLEGFCRRIGENLGITYSAGLTYKRQSECVLIDTTLWGVSMDNWHVWEWIEKDNVISRLNELYSTIVFLNTNILGGSIEKVQEMFKWVFIPEIVNNSWKNRELIEWCMKELDITWARLSKSFYMVNDFWNVRKTLKRLSIVWKWSVVIHAPVVKRNYFING